MRSPRSTPIMRLCGALLMAGHICACEASPPTGGDGGAPLDAFAADAPPPSDATAVRDAPVARDAWSPSDAAVADAGCVACDDAGDVLADAGHDASIAAPDAGQDGGRSDASTLDGGPVADTTPVVQLALGSTISCARRMSGRVMCWGNPTFVGWPAPVLTDATDIAVVDVTGYAQRRDGSIVQWTGTGGTLTSAAAMPPDPPMAPAMYAPGESFPLPTGDYVEIYAGRRHTCGRRMDGSIWCWGQNVLSQLGRETGELTETGIAYPAGEVLLGGARIRATSVAVGRDHTCVLLGDGRVMCWGSDSELQLGRWVPGLESIVPIEPEWY